MFDFLFSGWFWGFILIMLATGSIIKSIFKIKFSLFFIFILVTVIFSIINLINLNDSEGATYFATQDVIKIKDISEINNYNCAFCRTTFDLTLLQSSDTGSEEIQIKNLMGKLKILVSKSQKVKIQSKTFFGSGQTPDETKTVLGNHIYITSRYSKSSPHITVNIETIFGSTEVFEK